MEKKKSQIGIFLAINFLIIWGALFYLYFSQGATAGVSTEFITTMALLPGLSVLLLHLFQRKETPLSDMGFTPKFKKVWPYYIVGYLFPTVFTVIAVGLFFLILPEYFDPSASLVVETLTDMGKSEEVARDFLTTQLLLGVFAGPFVNIITSFTEELGFRGFLFSWFKQILPQKKWLAIVISSGIWTLWYLPLFFLGYHYGNDYAGFPVYGVLVGVAFQFFFGILLCAITELSGSIYAGMMLHSGVSAMAAEGLYFTKGSPSLLIGPSTYGLFGMITMMIAGSGALLLVVKKNQKKPK
jgi:membrane protease YdiL (CAAX protease family)